MTFGFCDVAELPVYVYVDGVIDQDQDVGEFVDASENVTVDPTHGATLFAEKSATGGLFVVKGVHLFELAIAALFVATLKTVLILVT